MLCSDGIKPLLAAMLIYRMFTGLKMDLRVFSGLTLGECLVLTRVDIARADRAV